MRVRVHIKFSLHCVFSTDGELSEWSAAWARTGAAQLSISTHLKHSKICVFLTHRPT